jgi:hypothetical protein
LQAVVKKLCMSRKQVGSIASLWRYPVKSMLGEALVTAAVNDRGLVGDRAYALLDVQTGRVASAKNPKKWAQLLSFQASFAETTDEQNLTPAVNRLLQK